LLANLARAAPVPIALQHRQVVGEQGVQEQTELFLVAGRRARGQRDLGPAAGLEHFEDLAGVVERDVREVGCVVAVGGLCNN